MKMVEHTWTEGFGLKNGLPDINWATRKLLTVYPTEEGWIVTICWGDTWGHLVFGNDEDFITAMNKARGLAIKHGCPAEWLPYTEVVE
jgi:GH24 family phage-related lysozyme (muramidase)